MYVSNTMWLYLSLFICDLEECVLFYVHKTVCRTVSYTVTITVVFIINGFQITSVLFLPKQKVKDKFPVLGTCKVHVGNVFKYFFF